MLVYWLVIIFITVERYVKFVSPTIIVNRLPPTQLRVHNDTSTGTACTTSCTTLSSATSCGTTPAPSVPSVPAAVPQPPPRVFNPADAPPDATHSTPIVQTFEICEEVKSNRLSPRVVFQSVQRCTFRARRFGHTSCVVPGFYWQLPPCM